MNKEQLIALGLTEEQADKVIEGYGQMVPKSRLDDKITELNEAKNEIATRDTQLEELKKVDAAGLQAKITELQQANETAKSEYETNLKKSQLISAVKMDLLGKVHDMDLVVSLIDDKNIELDENGNITKGLDEQIRTLQESKSFLFVEKQGDKPPAFKGFTPTDGKGADDKSGKGDDDGNFGKQLAEFSKNSSGGLEQARNSYFE